VQEVSRQGFEALAPVALEFAKAEGLEAHGRSIDARKDLPNKDALRETKSRSRQARAGGAR
jgi:hypothetical protein